MLWIEFLLTFLFLVVPSGAIATRYLIGDDPSEFWGWSLFLGLAIWSVGLNFLFQWTHDFSLAVFVLGLGSITASALSCWRSGLPPLPSKQFALVLALAVLVGQLYAIPYDVIGSNRYIAIMGGDAQNYARLADLFLKYSNLSDLPRFDGHAGMWEFISNERTGPSVLSALLALVTGADCHATLQFLNILTMPLYCVAGYIMASRFTTNERARLVIVGFLMVNCLILFNGVTSYTGKAIGVPLAMANAALMLESFRSNWPIPKIFVVAIAVLGQFHIYFESFVVLVPIIIALFFLYRPPFERVVLAALISIATAFVLTPNLLDILRYGVGTRLIDTPYWSTVRRTQFPAFMFGLHSYVPTGASIAPAYEYLIGEIALRTGLPIKVAAIGQSIAIAMSLLSVALTSATVGILAIAWRQLPSFSRLALIALVLAPTCFILPLCVAIFGYKQCYNALQILAPFLAVATGFAATEINQASSSAAVRAMLKSLYAALFAFAFLNCLDLMVRSVRDRSSVAFYKMQPDLIQLRDFIRSSAGPQPILLIDDREPGRMRGYTPEKYYTFYYLRDFQILFWNPQVHFPGNTVALLPEVSSSLNGDCRVLLVSPSYAQNKNLAGTPIFSNATFGVSDVTSATVEGVPHAHCGLSR